MRFHSILIAVFCVGISHHASANEIFNSSNVASLCVETDGNWVVSKAKLLDQMQLKAQVPFSVIDANENNVISFDELVGAFAKRNLLDGNVLTESSQDTLEELRGEVRGVLISGQAGLYSPSSNTPVDIATYLVDPKINIICDVPPVQAASTDGKKKKSKLLGEIIVLRKETDAFATPVKDADAAVLSFKNNAVTASDIIAGELAIGVRVHNSETPPEEITEDDRDRSRTSVLLFAEYEASKKQSDPPRADDSGRENLGIGVRIEQAGTLGNNFLGYLVSAEPQVVMDLDHGAEQFKGEFRFTPGLTIGGVSIDGKNSLGVKPGATEGFYLDIIPRVTARVNGVAVLDDGSNTQLAGVNSYASAGGEGSIEILMGDRGSALDGFKFKASAIHDHFFVGDLNLSSASLIELSVQQELFGSEKLTIGAGYKKGISLTDFSDIEETTIQLGIKF